MVAIAKHQSGQAAKLEKKYAHTHADLESRLKAVIDGGKVAINERIEELYSEWTAGRASKVMTGLMVVAGLVMGFTLSPWWFLLPIVSASCDMDSSGGSPGAISRRPA